MSFEKHLASNTRHPAYYDFMKMNNPEVAKNIYVYLNGDNYFPGRKIVVNRRYIPDFIGFLNEVTLGLGASFGAVRNIYTPTSGHRIITLDQLQTGMHVVAAGVEKFRKLDYRQIGLKKRQKTKQKLLPPPYRIKPLSMMNSSDRWRKYVKDPCLIYVYGNGDLNVPAMRLLLIPRCLKTWDLVLQEITNKLSRRTGHAVRKLYDLEYHQLNDPSELENGQYYIAVGSEKLKKCPYGELSKTSLTKKSYQPLPPIKTVSKSKMPQQTDSENTYSKMYAQRKSHQTETTVVESSAATNYQPLKMKLLDESKKFADESKKLPDEPRKLPDKPSKATEQPPAPPPSRKDEAESIIMSKPAKVKRSVDRNPRRIYSRPKLSCDDIDGVYRSRINVITAPEVKESEDIMVDYSYDQVSGRMVEEKTSRKNIESDKSKNSNAKQSKTKTTSRGDAKQTLKASDMKRSKISAGSKKSMQGSTGDDVTTAILSEITSERGSSVTPEQDILKSTVLSPEPGYDNSTTDKSVDDAIYLSLPSQQRSAVEDDSNNMKTSAIASPSVFSDRNSPQQDQSNIKDVTSESRTTDNQVSKEVNQQESKADTTVIDQASSEYTPVESQSRSSYSQEESITINQALKRVTSEELRTDDFYDYDISKATASVQKSIPSNQLSNQAADHQVSKNTSKTEPQLVSDHVVEKSKVTEEAVLSEKVIEEADQPEIHEYGEIKSEPSDEKFFETENEPKTDKRDPPKTSDEGSASPPYASVDSSDNFLPPIGGLKEAAPEVQDGTDSDNEPPEPSPVAQFGSSRSSAKNRQDDVEILSEEMADLHIMTRKRKNNDTIETDSKEIVHNSENEIQLQNFDPDSVLDISNPEERKEIDLEIKRESVESLRDKLSSIDPEISDETSEESDVDSDVNHELHPDASMGEKAKSREKCFTEPDQINQTGPRVKDTILNESSSRIQTQLNETLPETKDVVVSTVSDHTEIDKVFQEEIVTDKSINIVKTETSHEESLEADNQKEKSNTDLLVNESSGSGVENKSLSAERGNESNVTTDFWQSNLSDNLQTRHTELAESYIDDSAHESVKICSTTEDAFKEDISLIENKNIILDGDLNIVQKESNNALICNETNNEALKQNTHSNGLAVDKPAKEENEMVDDKQKGLAVAKNEMVDDQQNKCKEILEIVGLKNQTRCDTSFDQEVDVEMPKQVIGSDSDKDEDIKSMNLEDCPINENSTEKITKDFISNTPIPSACSIEQTNELAYDGQLDQKEISSKFIEDHRCDEIVNEVEMPNGD